MVWQLIPNNYTSANLYLDRDFKLRDICGRYWIQKVHTFLKIFSRIPNITWELPTTTQTKTPADWGADILGVNRKRIIADQSCFHDDQQFVQVHLGNSSNFEMKQNAPFCFIPSKSDCGKSSGCGGPPEGVAGLENDGWQRRDNSGIWGGVSSLGGQDFLSCFFISIFFVYLSEPSSCSDSIGQADHNGEDGGGGGIF